MPIQATPARPVLQYRWKLEKDGADSILVHYGLRNYGRHTQRAIKLEPAAAEMIRTLDGKRGIPDLSSDPGARTAIEDLVSQGILVDAPARRKPATPETRQVCVKCVNDDYILPGLEFDERGVCAFCQCYEHSKGLNALTANAMTEEDLLYAAGRKTGSRFDAMVLFTGGKDSSFLLWYLGKKLELRVLAAFWNMPYTSDSARDNIRRAMKRLPNVEFIERTVAWDVIKSAMCGQLHRVGMPCLCPTVAFALFYPLAVQEKIPMILAGIEEVQMAIMEYVFPKGAKTPAAGPPSPRQQTLSFLKYRAMPGPIRPPVAYDMELANYHASIKEQLAPLYAPLEEILRAADANPGMEIPLIKRLNTNKSYGNWQDVVTLLQRELDWQMPPGQKSMLHTSCRIEQVKDYMQFMRFRNMRTAFFPQSIVEISASVHFGLLPRDQALHQLDDLGYGKPPDVLFSMLADLGITDQDIDRSTDELHWALREE